MHDTEHRKIKKLKTEIKGLKRLLYEREREVGYYKSDYYTARNLYSDTRYELHKYKKVYGTDIEPKWKEFVEKEIRRIDGEDE